MGARRPAAPDTQLVNRVRLLPAQLTRARHRVRQLEAEARRLGLTDLIEETTVA